MIRTRSLARALATVVALAAAASLRSATGPTEDAPAWPLACRLASYGKYQEGAWAHLPSIGVRHLFLPVPSPEEVGPLKKRLAGSGLSPLVVRGQADLGKPGCLDELKAQLETCRGLGVKFMFLSPKHTGISPEAACGLLRQAGDLARGAGVTIALETHPDLGANAAAHLETMRRVDHPNVRVNFDTGNITYYNEGADVVAELEKIAPYVATVELKDHGGGLHAWDFPALGKGKIDFPGVLKVLRRHGYRGPITIEVEGVRGQEWDEARTREAIAESVAYLRRLGNFR